MKAKSIVFFLLISHSVFSQEISESNVILTQEKNNQWISQLEKLDFTNQLPFIKNRVLQDSCVYFYETQGGCGFGRTVQKEKSKEQPKEKTKTCYKPLLVFDGVPFEGKRAIDFINEEEIKETKILKGSSATALYGTRGSAGVILFTFKNKESLNKMERVIVKD